MLRSISFTSKNNEKGNCRSLFTDLHSHILPGIDDGSASVEESLKMLKVAYESGVKHIIATPHFYPHIDTPDRFLEKRSESVKRLSEALERERALGVEFPRIGVGAEVAFFSGMSRSNALESLCIEGTSLILVEMPFERWSEAVTDELFRIKSNCGLVPIIAHRYVKYQNGGCFDSIFSGEILIQANSSAFENRKTRKMCLEMLKEGEIDFIGSDCHNLSDRSPDMSRALEIIEKQLGAEAVEELERFGDFALKEATSII